MRRVHIWVSGSVQGIGYRSFIKEKAYEFNLNGFVKNLPDGRVEAVFEGDPSNIEKIIILCKRGLPASVITKMEEKEEVTENIKGFEIRY